MFEAGHKPLYLKTESNFSADEIAGRRRTPRYGKGEILRSGRGSISVFIVICFAAFILVSGVLLAAARSAAGKSTCDAVLQLAGRSVLSEFDRTLYRNYGLMAFRGDESYMEGNIKRYANASLKDDGELKDVQVALKGYSLLDVNNFEEQVVNAFESTWMLTKNIERGGGDGVNNEGFDYTHGHRDTVGRELKKKSVSAALPSDGYSINSTAFMEFVEGIIIKDIPTMDEVVSDGTDMFKVNSYIMKAFSNRQSVLAKDERFFVGEIEYILMGMMSDEDNYDLVKAMIYGIRYAHNHAYILLDKEKMDAINSIAQAAALIGGEEARITTKITTMELWVAAETKNDIQRLIAGDNAALVKTKKQWALNNLGDVLDGIVGTTKIAPEDERGQSYEDYLLIMLFMMNKADKLLHMMDLIQINMKGVTNGEFLIREHFVGFSFAAVSNGDRYVYKNNY